MVNTRGVKSWYRYGSSGFAGAAMPSHSAVIFSISLVPITASTSGKFVADVVAIPLHQAAGHHQPLRAAGLLVFGHLQDRVHRFLSWPDR